MIPRSELLSRSEHFLSVPNESIQLEDIRELQAIIREHNNLYYLDSAPIIDDAQYDRLFRKLSDAEVRFGVFDSESPTKRIGVMLSRQFEKGRHLSPMISLDNTYNAGEVLEFGKRARNFLDRFDPLASIIELKFDGLGISILYRNGSFVRALTRGNGVEGEDVSVNALEVGGIPRTIPFTDEIEIRGEVIMPHSEFDRVNRERLEVWDKLFANPRNAASGSLRQLDPMITRNRGLRFFAYSVPYFEARFEELGLSRYSEGIARLSEWGFSVSPFFEKFDTIESLAERVEAISSKKPVFDFDIDGLVIKFQDYALWKELWATEHHPRSAIAYKFPQELVRTRVHFIEHSVGRTGIVTPVAHLDPVGVTGVVVRRATLHNYEELERKDVRLGDQVFIQRAGEVIPEVVSVITDVRTGSEERVGPPERCPSCGTPLEKEVDKVAVFCPNRLSCPAQTSGALKAFVSKHAANIEGLGDKIIDLFLEKGFLSDFVSIYRLHNFRNSILELDGFEQKKTDNILSAIEGSRTMELARFLLALGIPEVGRKTAKILADHVALKMAAGVGNPDRIPDPEAQWAIQGQIDLTGVLFSLRVEELLEIRDIGPVGAESVVDYFADNQEMIRLLLSEVRPSVPVPKMRWGILNSASFCVTGSFESISRDEIHSKIEANGGEVRTSVSPKLKYLIVGTDAGSKLEKAKEYGVTVLSLSDFLGMIGE